MLDSPAQVSPAYPVQMFLVYIAKFLRTPFFTEHLQWLLLYLTLTGITKPCTHLHPPPPCSIHLHSAHFSLHPALCNTLNAIRTKDIARNGVISQNFGQKIPSQPFRLKIGTHATLVVLIPNPD